MRKKQHEITLNMLRSICDNNVDDFLFETDLFSYADYQVDKQFMDDWGECLVSGFIATSDHKIVFSLEIEDDFIRDLAKDLQRLEIYE